MRGVLDYVIYPVDEKGMVMIAFGDGEIVDGSGLRFAERCGV